MDPWPAIRAALDAGASYADVRVQRARSAAAELREGKLERLVEGSSAGAGVRVLVGGAWGFASTQRLGAAALRAAAEQAVRAARAASKLRRERVALAPAPARRLDVRVPARRAPGRVGLEDRVALLRDLDALARRPGIRARTLTLEDGEAESRLVSSEGADARVRHPRTLLAVGLTAERAGRRATYRARLGGSGGFELVRGAPAEAMVREACEAAEKLARARAPKGGRMPVVIDPDLAGVFVHEAVGHACEADLVVGGESLLAGRLGERIGSPAVSIVDDAAMPGSFGLTPVDDEGLRGGRRVLVEGGVLKGFLQSRETAAKLGMEPNGAARAESYAHRPIVRMSTVLLEPGDWSLEELLEGVRRGVYAKGTRGGQVDTVRGTFHFSAQEAFAVERGELAAPLRDVGLSGSILTTLRRVDAVAKDLRLAQPGFCGKGQWVPVGDGGPHLRVRECTVGGAG